MWCRVITIAVLFITSLSLAGCIIIPANYYESYSRKNIDEELPADIVTGTTTREAVLMKLGEPDKTSEDETEFWYIASTMHGWIFFLILPMGGEMRQNYIHVLCFDRNGIIETIKLDNNPYSQQYLLSIEHGNTGTEFTYSLESHFSKSPITFPAKME